MSTDEYVPSEDEMREAYVWLSAGDNEGAREQAAEDFNRGLARVRRDAAREALDGMAHRFELELGHAASLNRGLDAQRVKLSLLATEKYCDTHYPEETPMEHCDFCETDVESTTTGKTGVSICPDCRGEAEVSP